MQESMDFSKFGKTFQENLVQIILEDRPFSEQIEEVLDVNFFEPHYLRVFVKILFDYRVKYGAHPSKDIVASMLKSGLDNHNEAVQKQVRDYFVRAHTNKLTDCEYIKDTSLDFCKKQKLKSAILKSVDLIKNNSFDEVKILIDDALKLGTDRNHGHDFLKDFEARYEIKARNPISTGWPTIDGMLRNGLGKRELGVVIAPTGAGKSMALAHLGATAVKNGKNVVHYTLELSEPVVGHRYDSCISGVPLSDLHQMKDLVYSTVEGVEGSLTIKEYPTRSATPETLKKHLKKLIEKTQQIDMVIVDYADLLSSTRKYNEKRNELEAIYESLRALAQEFDCPVWTASQTNRSGLNAEVVTMESISEAFNKCFVADFIFSISRTIKDKNANTGRIFVAKNRNGPDGIVLPIKMDTSVVKIEIMENDGSTVESIELDSAKREAKNLKEQYKKFRQNK